MRFYPYAACQDDIRAMWKMQLGQTTYKAKGSCLRTVMKNLLRDGVAVTGGGKEHQIHHNQMKTVVTDGQ